MCKKHLYIKIVVDFRHNYDLENGVVLYRYKYILNDNSLHISKLL